MGANRAAGPGRPGVWSRREITNAIPYVLRGEIFVVLPTDLPPKSTVFRWFALWRDTGVFETINHLLVMADRERVGREASRSAAVIESQSVKTPSATTAACMPFPLGRRCAGAL